MPGLLTDYDVHLLNEGRHAQAYAKLGAHPGRVDGVDGIHFAVAAPAASHVAVIGDFNGWSTDADPMTRRNGSGVWERFVPDAAHGSLYMFRLHGPDGTALPDKADPYGFSAELRPRTASRVWVSRYVWGDTSWMTERASRNTMRAPISIYEVHLGSWRRGRDDADQDRWLTYRELAEQLAEYLPSMGFTHLEILPVTEHPLDASWGYQTLGFYAPTSRFGMPDDFRFLVDTLHRVGVGVILDWVPAHFPFDGHGLSRFDGTPMYEHPDPNRGRHPDWDTLEFEYGRPEVRNFLVSNARFWLDAYHVDGLRVDAVASMLYLDYSRREGEWVANEKGGRENLEAVKFITLLNERVYEDFPDVMMIAEESTTWTNVSAPTHIGGLGFGFKWNLGWMHDTLGFMSKDSGQRSHHVDDLGFSLTYAFSENFILPLSHDEVVHGKGSVIGKMPGHEWEKFANARLLYGYMFGHPGKKLLFMGNEFGQIAEWRFDASLDWHLATAAPHAGLQRWVRDLNMRYRSDPRLHELDCDGLGFEWVDHRDTRSMIVSFFRRGATRTDSLLFVCNFAPVERDDYRVGVPQEGVWYELLNSDATCYGGDGRGNLGATQADDTPMHGRTHSVRLRLPPLSVLVLSASLSDVETPRP